MRGPGDGGRARGEGGLAAAGLLLFVLALAGCPSKGAKKVLYLYNWADYVGRSTLGRFERETGIHVVYDTFESNEALLAKLESGAVGYDVIVPSDYFVGVLRRRGLLKTLSWDRLPNTRWVDPRFSGLAHDPTRSYCVPYAWGIVGLGYRSDLVPEAPRSWSALWDPRYRNRVVVLDDMREVIGVALRMAGHSMNAVEPRELADAARLLATLKPNVRAFNSVNYRELLLSGDAWIVLGWSGDVAVAMRDDPKVRFVVPEEGGSLFVDNLCIPKGARHPEEAERFIDFMLEPESAADLTQTTLFATPNLGALRILPAALRKNPAVYIPEGEFKRGEFLKDLGPVLRDYDRIWTEFKSR